jgi:hypothetical protein
LLQLAPGATWDSSKRSTRQPLQPWWAGGGRQQQQYYDDALFDAEVDEMLGISPEQQQQQQQMPTAADWVLGEFADAAQGLHTFSTLDEDDAGAAGYGSEGSSSSSKAAAAAAPLELGARDLRQLIQQYSWNADKPELLQARTADSRG